MRVSFDLVKSGDAAACVSAGNTGALMATAKFVLKMLLSDPHSPPRYRVNGVLRNMPEFYDAFGVVEGDGMYLPPEQRVKIW